MAEIQIKSEHNVYEEGAPLTTLGLLVEGSVSLDLPLGNITLKPGDVVGLLDLMHQTHSYTYTAISDVVVNFQQFKDLEQFCQILKNSPTLAKDFCLAALQHVSHIAEAFDLVRYECNSLYSALMQYHQDYVRLCKQYEIAQKQLPGLEDIQPLSLENDFDEYIGKYYKDLEQIFSDDAHSGIFTKTGFMGGFFVRVCEDMHQIMDAYQEMNDYLSQLSKLLINKDKLDFLELYSTLLIVASQAKADTQALTSAIGKLFFRADGVSSIDHMLYKQRLTEYQELLKRLEDTATIEDSEPDELTVQTLTDSLSRILDYARVDSDFRTSFLKQVTAYKKEPDKTGDSDDLRRLRRSLSKDFLKLYVDAFLQSMQEPSQPVPAIVKMFFYFGYVDEQLCGIDNALQLYAKYSNWADNDGGNVFMLYDWLKLIYTGQREPHKDEFDRNYPAYIQSLEKEGSVKKEDVKLLLENTTEKVKFEINNLVANGLKITSGSPTTHCSILSEHNFIKPPVESLIGEKEISQALSEVLAVDFSAYHREVMFSDATLGTQHEFVQKQILPEFILLPGIGMRGSLWQEIQGADRQTPACMLLPVFCLADLNLIMLRLTGEFRWEMCKRVQGARWNDLTYPSLTSDYTDYVQFYKKNNELSPDMKQKCKQQLARVRNRFKESFLLDYMAWVMFEAKGSPRLNKVSRTICATYCPFPKEKREELKKNPLYTKLIELYDNKKTKELGRIHTIIARVQRNNKNYCPEALLQQAEFLEM